MSDQITNENPVIQARVAELALARLLCFLTRMIKPHPPRWKIHRRTLWATVGATMARMWRAIILLIRTLIEPGEVAGGVK
jgi:hypothetical protein